MSTSTQILKTRSVPFQYRVEGKDYFWVYLFFAPFLIFYLGFTLWPLFASLIYSFLDWDGAKPITWERFVGVKNYLTILKTPLFWKSFINTVIFATVNTAIKLPLSLLMAIILLRKWLWMKRFFRTLFFTPMIVPVAIAGLIFTLLLNPANGAVNDFLKSLGVIKRSLDFLGNSNTALLTVILVSVWQIFGQYMIYWMAALQNVPEEVYEAAEIDGVNEWQKLIHITLPIIRPLAVIIGFLAFVNALRVFGLIVTMTAGGPGSETYVVSYFIYTQAFSEVPFRYGYASSAALFFGVTMLMTVTFQGYFVRRAKQRQAEYGLM